MTTNLARKMALAKPGSKLRIVQHNEAAQPLEAVQPPPNRLAYLRQKRYQAETVATAVRSRLPWSAEEVEWLHAHHGRMTIAAMAAELGRTWAAVKYALAQPDDWKGGGVENTKMRLNLADSLESRTSYEKAASRLGVGRSTLHRLATEGRFPDGERFGDLRERIEDHLTELGADEDEIGRLWEHYSLGHKGSSFKLGGKMHGRKLLTPETLEFFGLDLDPIALEPDGTDNVFESRGFRYILATLTNIVNKRLWFALTGDIGSGKSTAVRTWTARARAADPSVRVWRPGFADMGKLTIRSVMEWIVRDHGQAPRADHAALQRQVESILVHERRDGHKPVLVLDEAHHLTHRFLSALKNLWEMEDPDRPLTRMLAIVLVGQTPLKNKLETNYDIEEVAKRVVKFDMPSARDTVPEYLRHRIREAGGKPLEIVTDGALEAIAERANTFLEAGNIFAAALEQARTQELRKMDKAHVVKVSPMVDQRQRKNGAAQPSAQPLGVVK